MYVHVICCLRASILSLSIDSWNVNMMKNLMHRLPCSVIYVRNSTGLYVPPHSRVVSLLSVFRGFFFLLNKCFR